MRPAVVAAALAAAALSLGVTPAAFAWTTLAGGVVNTVVPSMLVTQAGTEIVSFETPNANTISVSRARGAPKIVVSGDPVAGRTQLIQQPSGAIQLYFPNAQGVARMTSTDDGQSWTGPIQTQSHTLGGVMGAAVAADGTPYFSQDGTGFVNVFRGLNGETVKNVFPRCCGYAESLAVDTAGLVQVAFYSNADPDGTFVYNALGGDLAPTATTSLKPTAPHDDRIPLVADRSGTTFLAWPPGYPTATSLTVVPFHNGQPAGDGVKFTARFTGGDPHAALAADGTDRLWTVWTQGGLVRATHSRSHGSHFGALVASPPAGGTEYQVSAAALPGNPGSVDVIVNTGSTLVEQQLEPGLSVRVTPTKKRIGKKTVTTYFAWALDDGIGVPGATFKIGGRTIHANGTGGAKVPKGRGTVAAAGYVGATFKAG